MDNFLDIIVKGMMVGIICSAPMGPVGVLCVQRTLNKGRWYGFVTGLGATLSDVIYAVITGLGMSFVMEFIDNPQCKSLLQVFGSVLLFAFGMYCFRSDPRKKVHRSGKRKGTLVQNFVTAFIVTFSNPLIILLFMAAFAQLAFIIPDTEPVQLSLGCASIAAGAVMWWYGLTWLVDKVRGFFSIDSVVIINRIIGTTVMVFSLAVFIGTAFNLFSAT